MKTIFISYSVLDKEKVSQIRRDIYACGHQVWIYPEAIDPGKDILKTEAEGIAESDVVLIMLSKNSEGSTAVKKEINLAKAMERKTGRKKMYLVKIDDLVDPRDTTIQMCDLSHTEEYTAEFHRLLRKIETHKNYELKYRRREDEDDENWDEVNVWLTGPNMQQVKNVDYYIHKLLACNEYTKTKTLKGGKDFCLTFYTPHGEVVYAIVYFKGGGTEELRIDV